MTKTVKESKILAIYSITIKKGPEMELISKNKVTKDEAKELISVAGQLQKLRLNPEMTITDIFRSSFRFMMISVVLFVAVILMIVFWGMSTMLTIALVLWAVCFLFSAMLCYTLNKRVNDYMAKDDGLPKKIILDEDGVSFVKEKSQHMQLAWSNLAFARGFKYIFMFVSKDNTLLSIVASAEHSEAIKAYIKENNISVKAYKIIYEPDIVNRQKN